MRTGYLAIGLAAVVSVVLASCAPDSRVPDPGKSAGAGFEVEDWQEHQGFGNNTGSSLAAPIGNVSEAGPGFLEREHINVRRTNEESGGVNGSIGSPDQPAGW